MNCKYTANNELCERGCPCEISGDIRHALDYAALAAKLAGMGLTVVPGDAKEFARAADEQRRQVHEMARIIGLKAPSGEVGR